MDSRFVLGLWLYLQELHSKKQDVTETCNQEEKKIKKVLSFDILFCENRHFPVNKKLLTSELSSLLIS